MILANTCPHINMQRTEVCSTVTRSPQHIVAFVNSLYQAQKWKNSIKVCYKFVYLDKLLNQNLYIFHLRWKPFSCYLCSTIRHLNISIYQPARPYRWAWFCFLLNQLHYRSWQLSSCLYYVTLKVCNTKEESFTKRQSYMVSSSVQNQKALISQCKKQRSFWTHPVPQFFSFPHVHQCQIFVLTK